MLFQKDLWCAWEKQANFKILCFKFFVSRDKFSRIVQVFLKFANFNHNWNIFSLKKSWKIDTSFGTLACQFGKWHIFGTLTRQHVKMKCWHTFGQLARQFEKWHVFGKLARKNEMLARFWHVGTHGTRFSKLVYKHLFKIY